MKQIRVTKIDKMSNEIFGVENGEVYDVVSEGQGEKRYGFCINTKRGPGKLKSSIVIYKDECEVLN